MIEAEARPRTGYPIASEGGAKPLRGDPITGDRYYSRAFAEAEWNGMWRRVRHIGGRLAQLEEAGDYVVHDFLRQSVIMVRQEDGSVRAFHNSCRHRGNRLVSTETGGVVDGLRCAYHGWRYAFMPNTPEFFVHVGSRSLRSGSFQSVPTGLEARGIKFGRPVTQA